VGILLGLLAATFYGAADFLGGLATRRTSIFAVPVVSQLVGAHSHCSFLFFFCANRF